MIKLEHLDTSMKVLVIELHKQAIFSVAKSIWSSTLLVHMKDRSYQEQKANIEKTLKMIRSRPTHKFWISSTLGDALDIAPMFAEAPSNCVLPIKWRDILSEGEHRQWWAG